MVDKPESPGNQVTNVLSTLELEKLAREFEVLPGKMQAWCSNKDPQTLGQLFQSLSRCKRTFQQARRLDGVLMTDEVLALLGACAQSDGSESDSDDFSEAEALLVETLLALRQRLAYMRTLPQIETLLPVLPVLDNCRACRGAELLLASLLDAVDISLDDSAVLVSKTDQSEAWQALRDQVRQFRSGVQQAMLGWYSLSVRESVQTSDGLKALMQLRESLTDLINRDISSKDCLAWNDLFEAAWILIDSVVAGRSQDGAALRRLFAILERCLAQIMNRESHEPPRSLMKSLLWHVANSDSDSTAASRLHQRYRLQRFERLDQEISLELVAASLMFKVRDAGTGSEPAVDSAIGMVSVAEGQCRDSLDGLQGLLDNALLPGGQARRELPDEAMLRYLLSLNQSLQSLGWVASEALLAPLHKLALNRQRVAETLDAREIRQFKLLVTQLQSTLKEAPELKQSFDSEPPEEGHSLTGVFDEEAHDLVERMYELLEQDKEESESARIAGVLAHLHTLKGSARMAGRALVAEHAHALEGDVQSLPIDAQLARLRKGRVELQTLILNELAERQLYTSSAMQLGFNDAAKGEFSELPLEGINDAGFDELLRSTTIIGVNLAQLNERLERLLEVSQDLESTSLQWRRLQDSPEHAGSAAERELLNDLEAAREQLLLELQQASSEQSTGSRSTATLQQNLIRSRRMPAEAFRERLQRVIDDTSVMQNRQIQLHVDGGQTMLDRRLYRQLLPALEHLVRNACIHGTEMISERLALGKTPQNSVRLSIQADGVDLIVSVYDDGRGVDSTAINLARVRSGEAPFETMAALQNELFKTGFSTLEKASPLAGRGLGLSAVQQLLEQLGGRVGLWTRPNEGTRITMTLPQPVAISQSVLVRAANRFYALPAECVKHIEPQAGDDSNRNYAAGTGEYHQLELLLGISTSPIEAQSSNSGAGELSQLRRRLHVDINGSMVILDVEEILGYRELIAQSLGHQVASLGRFSGGSVLPDGQQVLMLDMQRLLESSNRKSQNTAKHSPTIASGSSALVVDDSLTMRVAATRYLEARGVLVTTARDGVEALSMLEKHVPTVLIVDVDMPKLDGFELLERLQSRLAGNLPAILVVSSRDKTEDVERSRLLGAGAFLVKPWGNEALNDALVAVGVRLPDITIA